MCHFGEAIPAFWKECCGESKAFQIIIDTMQKTASLAKWLRKAGLHKLKTLFSLL